MLAIIILRFEIFHQTLIIVYIFISTDLQRLRITHGGAAQACTFSFIRHGGEMVRGCAASLPVLARR